jgi:hypothetical protein
MEGGEEVEMSLLRIASRLIRELIKVVIKILEIRI